MRRCHVSRVLSYRTTSGSRSLCATSTASGRRIGEDILKEAGIDPNVRAKNLTEDEVSRIAGVIDRTYVVEGQLRRQIQQNIARPRDIQCYRGHRHRRGLPGARSADANERPHGKGPKKTVAGKKGVKELRH